MAAKYQDVVEWLLPALDALAGGQGKIVLNVNGGAVEADLVTSGTDVDEQGRKVKYEKRTTTRLRIEGVKPPAPIKW